MSERGAKLTAQQPANCLTGFCSRWDWIKQYGRVMWRHEEEVGVRFGQSKVP
jgi:hypothetical protein